MKPYYEQDGITIYHGDCFDVLPCLSDQSVDMVLTDPPYFNVKSDSWDRQWKTPESFLDWLDGLFVSAYRLLGVSGSLYCFASPRMAARVEVRASERFNVLNRIRWIKDAGWHNRSQKESLRSFLSPWEEIIFAEHYGSEGGGTTQDELLRGVAWRPVLDYIRAEFVASRLSRREVDAYFKTANVAQYWLQERGFILPTEDKWAGLQDLRPGYFCRCYEDIRREYESLRGQYESTRRHFSVSADVPFTDVWNFKAVAAYPGKHPCEKPIDMLRHMIVCSARPGALVLDAFMGGGSVLCAAQIEGRRAIGIEIEERYCEIAAKRLSQGVLPMVAS